MSSSSSPRFCSVRLLIRMERLHLNVAEPDLRAFILQHDSAAIEYHRLAWSVRVRLPMIPGPVNDPSIHDVSGPVAIQNQLEGVPAGSILEIRVFEKTAPRKRYDVQRQAVGLLQCRRRAKRTFLALRHAAPGIHRECFAYDIGSS